MSNYIQKNKAADHQEDSDFIDSIEPERDTLNLPANLEDEIPFHFVNENTYNFNPNEKLIDSNYDKNNQNRLNYTVDELNRMVGWIENQKKIYSSSNCYSKIVYPETLNKLQRFSFDIVEEHIVSNKQLLMSVIGSGGTGKSEVISAITTKYHNCIKTCAASAKAAILVNGETVHALFSIPTKYEYEYKKLSKNKKRELEEYFEGVNIIIIDEFMMNGQDIFGFIDMRLREITGHSDMYFGGLNVLLFGDPLQLPPIRRLNLYDTNPKSTNEINGYKAYLQFDTVVKLTENMRQQLTTDPNQIKFIDILERFRRAEITIDDWLFLNTRNPHLNDIAYFDKAILISPTREKVEEINNCKLNQLNQPIAILTSENIPSRAKNLADENFKQLTNIKYIAIGAPIIYLWNTWKEAGLLNGAQGVVKDIIYPANRNKDSQPETIIVKFDVWNGPQFFTDPNKHNWIPLNVVSYYNPDKNCTRTGFPFSVCFAITVHKAQGSTFDMGIIDFGENEFALGMAYTQLSRFKDINRLLIHPFSYERVTSAIRNQPGFIKRLKEEERLETLATNTIEKYRHLLTNKKKN